MPMQARLESLKAKKEKLEQQIEEENKHAKPDEAKIAKLKKEKLSIKEEMDSLATQ